MGFDPISLALSKNYTAETVEGMGAIKGDPGPQGPSGPPGPDGNDGFSPTVSVTDISGGHRVTITDASGPQSFDVMDGQDGSGSGAPDLTAGDGIAIEENTVSVTNPVRGILTQAEFDALPEAQRASGTYFVDDGQGGSCGEVYDGQERVIGTWFGKPLYRKVIKGITFTPNGIKEYPEYGKTALDIDSIVSMNAIAVADGDEASLPYVSYSGTTNDFNLSLFLQIGFTSLAAYNRNKNAGSKWNNAIAKAILKYTKTTDPEVSE